MKNVITSTMYSQGVRLLICNGIQIAPEFQSTHSRRVRLQRLLSFVPTMLFQSTHSRRVRHGFYGLLVLVLKHFNPRTHEECDFTLRIALSLVKRFQSTHSRRVRQGRNLMRGRRKLFQSTHSRRVRQYLHAS